MLICSSVTEAYGANLPILLRIVDTNWRISVDFHVTKCLNSIVFSG